RYMQRLESEGLLASQGNTRGRSYGLKKIADVSLAVPLQNVDVERLWRQEIAPHLQGLKAEIVAVCRQGFDELLRNAAKYSQAEEVFIRLSRTYAEIHLAIADRGEGIFAHIQRAHGLPDSRSALLELCKGGSIGQGLFYLSWLCDELHILSGDLY